MNIVVTGYAGLNGSLTIFKNEDCREKLLKRYPKSFFGVLENHPEHSCRPAGLEKLFLAGREQGLAEDAADGGVLSALWRLLKKNHRGGCYSQKSIPVLQQTIEICEFFGINPYRLSAADCIVWLSEDAGLIAGEAAPAGVPLSVIGFTSKGAAIRRTDTESDSSLRRPEGDELTKIKEINEVNHYDK